jgi:2-hydroxychromene-2-carboxylate isomerase
MRVHTTPSPADPRPIRQPCTCQQENTLSRAVDYYFAPFSPDACLGHRRFVQIASKARASVRVRPMDLMAVFAATLSFHPRFFPVSGEAASRLIVTVEQLDGTEAECGLPAMGLGQSEAPEVVARYAENTRDALAAQVFGSPSYVIDGEVFRGQARLDFVQRAFAGS